MNSIKQWAGLAAVLAGSAVGAARADTLLPLQAGPLTIGGAVRYNIRYDDWADEHGAIGDVVWDSFRVDLDLYAGNVIGSGEYRYYPRNNHDYFHCLHHAWLGFLFGDESEVHLGVHQVPFGLQPYASHNFWFSMPFYLGFEDNYALGIKSIRYFHPWTLKMAYYVTDGGSYHDDRSEDAARYSFDVINADGVNNEERNHVNSRLTYLLEHGRQATSELGASLQYGQIYNRDTRDSGDHYAAALHLEGNYGRWKVLAQAIHYDYELRNPPGQPDEFVKIGARGSVFDMVTSGTVLAGGVSYTLPVSLGSIEAFTFYNDYSILFKDSADYNNSELNVLGVSFAAGRFFTYVDLIAGRNAPWLNSPDPLAAGSGDIRATRLNVNIGYYF